MSDRYILDVDGNPVPEPDLIKWGQWFKSASDPQQDGVMCGRHVAVSLRGEPGSEVRVSTVFLGVDHGWRGQLELYETMVFGPCSLDQHCERYATRAEAEAGHAEMVQLVELAIAAPAAEPAGGVGDG